MDYNGAAVGLGLYNKTGESYGYMPPVIPYSGRSLNGFNTTRGVADSIMYALVSEIRPPMPFLQRELPWQNAAYELPKNPYQTTIAHCLENKCSSANPAQPMSK